MAWRLACLRIEKTGLIRGSETTLTVPLPGKENKLVPPSCEGGGKGEGDGLNFRESRHT